MLDRRQLLTGVVGGLLGGPLTGIALPRPALAQQPGVTALSSRVALVTAGRTNVLALTTPDGLVVVDSGAPDLVEPLMAALRPLGRVSTVFNTHFHPENTGGNEALRQAGAAIVAHENTRLWMATPTWLPTEDRYRQPRPKGAHPTKTFYIDGSMQPAGERIDYGYLIEAHTSGDVYVFFRDSNVLAVGDVASPARDPELDYLTGAWIGGRADALARLVDLAGPETKIVPGFGPVMTRAQLQAERDLMKAIYDRTVDRVREGDSAEDMLEGGVLNGLARTLTDPHKFLYDVHKGLWAHHNKLSPNVV
ncbi:MAG TPA: MBL fold metallo-hydrolase [Vicinamibacterales bacterium]|jgi:glyoxylase-like metal-dependent hydrolase (beta-lactamase superfamily II)|nr:MBL fold metallo-hydrolase [Vicinamibacterales bacterium]